MPINPFSRKPKNPVDQALDAFDGVRSDAADYAAAVRDAAADIAETLTELGPPAPKRRAPVLIAVGAAVLGVGYVVKSRLGGGAPEIPGPAASPAATETAARTTATEAAATTEVTPAVAGDTEEPREPQAETAESAAANGKPAEAEAESEGEAEEAEEAEGEKG